MKEPVYFYNPICTNTGNPSMSPNDIPSAVVDKCFIQYSPTGSPSLNGVPVVLDDESAPEQPSICLSRPLLERACLELRHAFDASSRLPLVDFETGQPSVLPITVLYSAHLNCHISTDASLRYISNHLEADVVIIDPADFAAGRRELSDAFWQMYRLQFDSADSDEPQVDLGISSLCQTHAQSDTPEPSSVKTQCETVYSAVAAVRAFLRMGLNDNESNRRRILYIRDFGSFSKAMAPLLRLFLDATSSGPRTLVLAGLSPILRVSVPSDSPSRSDKKKTQHERLISVLRDDNYFTSLLESRYSAQWRKPRDYINSDRYQSLEDVFNSMFVNRYQGSAIASRNDSYELRDGDELRLYFRRILPVSVVRALPPAARGAFDIDRRRRFLMANLWRLQGFTAKSGKLLQYSEEDCHQSGTPEPGSVLETLQTQAILDVDPLSCIADSVQQNSTVLDVISAFDSRQLVNVQRQQAAERARAEWHRILDGVAHEVAPAEFVTAETEPVVKVSADPIVEQVRRSELDSDETRFLEYIVDPTAIRTTFDDVCLKPEVVDALRTAVSLPILFPKAFSTGILSKESLGGVLLFGPPGTGKTMACRALAKESGSRMLQVSASVILQCHVGESEKLISAIFALARRLGPCILFIDEIDGLFSKRTGKSSEWHRSQLTVFTQEMDGLRTADLAVEKRIIVVGATNRPQDLDSAVVRRLSRRVLVDLPTVQQRKTIIEHYLKGEQCDINTSNIALKAQLFSGSDLRHLVLAAALTAFKESVIPNWKIQYGEDGLPLPAQDQDVPPRVIKAKHFDQALKEISASGATNRKDIEEMRRWERELFQSDFCS